MHLGNGIICPITAIPMFAITLGGAVYAFKNLKTELTKDKILPAISLSAVVFALQMINFAIPQTGSSGHIIGAILLAVILGPCSAFLSMCAILLVQAVFFADGGLMALGCNIFNMAFLACFVVYPFVFKPLKNMNKPFLAIAASSFAALQLAAIAVVVETSLSGSITGNYLNFAALMQAIHLPIALIEGLISAGIYVLYQKITNKNFAISTGIVSLILAGIISQFACAKPDGLEWTLLKISDSVVGKTQGILYSISEAIQAKSAVLLSIPESFANLSGLLCVVFLVYLMCLSCKVKNIKN